MGSDHERYHKHGPSSDPYDVERRAMRHDPREIHDRELDEVRETYRSPFVRRALAGELPAKVVR